MLFLQDIATIEVVEDMIRHAFDASPYNAVGYGIALSLSLLANVVLAITVVRLYKVVLSKDKANDKYSAEVTKTLIELKLRLEDTRTLKEDVIRVLQERIK